MELSIKQFGLSYPDKSYTLKDDTKIWMTYLFSSCSDIYV